MAEAARIDRAALLPEFCRITSRGKFQNPPHIRLMTSRLHALAAREIRREMTLAPPRHGKSQLRAIYFPAWYLCNFPHHRVVIASNSADLAVQFSGRVRDIIDEFGHNFGIRVRDDRRSIDDWEIEHNGKRTGGGLYAVGVGGQLTGRGADLLIIDDPVKSAEEALSPGFRQKQWDWYASVADTRLEPGGVMCLTMTPWHGDDLHGRILEVEPEEWNVLRLPALAEEDDPLGRPIGQPLWPERYGVEFFERKRKQDPFWFDALFQLRPRPKDGGMFKEHWFKDKIVFSSAPIHAKRIRFWDKAATKGGGDWTVGLLMAAYDGWFWVEHVVRGQWGSAERDRIILDTCIEDNARYPSIVTWGEQEPGSGGKESGEGLVKILAGYRVQVLQSTGSKVARAEPFANQCAGGNVFLASGPWNQPYLKEVLDFPNGKHDDQVDASSGAFNRLFLGRTASGAYVTDAQESNIHVTDHGGGYIT